MKRKLSSNLVVPNMFFSSFVGFLKYTEVNFVDITYDDISLKLTAVYFQNPTREEKRGKDVGQTDARAAFGFMGSPG